MANKAIVYAIYPNQIQDNQCQNTFGSCRFVYNKMLNIQQERYEKGEKHLSKISANNYCNQELKKDYPFLKEIDKFAITNAVYHLSDSYDRFFKHLGRFPKYKNKHKSKKSYTTNLTNNNIEIGVVHYCLTNLTDYMKIHNYDTTKELNMYQVFTEGVNVNSTFHTIEDAYAFMKIMVNGFNGEGLFVAD